MQSSQKQNISILKYRTGVILGMDAIEARTKYDGRPTQSHTQEEIERINARHWFDDGRYDGNLSLPYNYFQTSQPTPSSYKRLDDRLIHLINQREEKKSEFNNDFCSNQQSDAQRMLWLQDIAIKQLATAFGLTISTENSDEYYRMFDSIKSNYSGQTTRAIKTARILLEYAAYYGSTWACHMIIKGIEKGHFKPKHFNGYGITDFVLLLSRNFQFLIVYPECEINNPLRKLQQCLRPPAYTEYASYWNQFSNDNIYKKSSSVIEEFQILYNELVVLSAAITSVIKKQNSDALNNLSKYFSCSGQLLNHENCSDPLMYQLILERDKLAGYLTKLAPAMFNLADAFHSNSLSANRTAAADMNVIGPRGANHLTTQLDRILKNAITDIECFGATSVSFAKEAFTDLLNHLMHKAINSRTCQLDTSFSFDTATTLLNAYKKAIDVRPSKSMFAVVRNQRDKERAPEIFWSSLFGTLLEPSSQDSAANHQHVEKGLILFIFLSLNPSGVEQLTAKEKDKITDHIKSRLANSPEDSLEISFCRLISEAAHVKQLTYPTSPGITMMSQKPPTESQPLLESNGSENDGDTYNSALTGISGLTLHASGKH